MPIYEYECLSCGRVHEAFQKFSDKPLTTCPECGGKIKKIISNTSFVLKGTGWYKTDYASGSKKAEGPDKKEETKTEDKKEKKAETKTEAAVKTG